MWNLLLVYIKTLIHGLQQTSCVGCTQSKEAGLEANCEKVLEIEIKFRFGMDYINPLLKIWKRHKNPWFPDIFLLRICEGQGNILRLGLQCFLCTVTI